MNGHAIPIANIYYLLCYAWDHVNEGNVERLEELEEFDAARDLLGKVLAEGAFRLLRRGLDRGYRNVQDDLAGIRGKLPVSETAKRALRFRGRVACAFDEMTHDVLHNRIIRATLKTLLGMPELDSKVRKEVRLAFDRLPGVTVVPLSRREFRQVHLDRNRRYYRFLLAVCRLIHERLLVDEQPGGARFLDFSEEQMASLYERFILHFYRREQDRYHVNRTGRVIRWIKEGTPFRYEEMIPQMEADLVLETRRIPGRRIIVDAKYYREALDKRYGQEKIRSDHLYQLLAYLRNREAGSERTVRHEGMLLYPTVDAEIRADVCLEGFTVRVRSINLAQDWRKIHADMLALIDLPAGLQAA